LALLVRIAAGSGTGITINNPGGQVTIRNLTIRVSSGGFDGIDITGGDVHLENVLILGTPTSGVLADGASNPVHLSMKNVTVTNARWGINIKGASVSLRDSVIRGGFDGISVIPSAGRAAVALLERCELSYNSNVGLAVDNTAGGGATARVSDTVITGNGTGIVTFSGAQIISFRTNMLAGNTTDGATPFSISLK